MEPKPIKVTIPVIFSRAIFESCGFFFGVMIGVNAGFVFAFLYIAVGGN